jgi:hypothetical protein
MTSPVPRQLPRNFAHGLAVSAPPICGASETATAKPTAKASRLKNPRPEKSVLEFDKDPSPSADAKARGEKVDTGFSQKAREIKDSRACGDSTKSPHALEYGRTLRACRLR